VALPRSLDQSAYRIIQEALTNALRHAGGTIAHVAVRYRAEQLELEVANDGRAGNGSEPAAGRRSSDPDWQGRRSGLIGMRDGSRCSGASWRRARGPPAASWSAAGSP
jgi:signal transduction histidine kinase